MPPVLVDRLLHTQATPRTEGPRLIHQAPPSALAPLALTCASGGVRRVVLTSVWWARLRGAASSHHGPWPLSAASARRRPHRQGRARPDLLRRAASVSYSPVDCPRPPPPPPLPLPPGRQAQTHPPRAPPREQAARGMGAMGVGTRLGSSLVASSRLPSSAAAALRAVFSGSSRPARIRQAHGCTHAPK